MIKNKETLKGFYFVQEKGCLNPLTGAYNHISIGINQLSRTFEMSLYNETNKLSLNNISISIKKNNYETSIAAIKRGVVYGTLKDIQILALTFFKLFKIYKILKKNMPDFIYERKSYLDFSVLIASRILKIPHFYESNGLQFKSREKYYNSSFKFINKFIEKFMYKSSSYVFFVGSYGDFWKINKLNWINVENGIESRFITEINDEIEKNNIIDICFIGRYMSHHRLDILIDGLYKIKDKGLKFRINLIGSGLVEVEKHV